MASYQGSAYGGISQSLDCQENTSDASLASYQENVIHSNLNYPFNKSNIGYNGGYQVEIMDTVGEPVPSESLLFQHLIKPVPASLTEDIQLSSSTIVNPNAQACLNTKFFRATGDRPWICNLCSFPFKHKGNLLEHMRFFHMKGSVPCNSCPKVFPTSKHLRIHRKNHSLEAGRCPHCRSAFTTGQGNMSQNYYQELYKRHLPECRRCPANITKLMNFSSCAFNGPNEDCVIWRCLICCNSFSELSEYKTHACKEKGFAIDSVSNEAYTSDSHVEDLPIFNADEKLIPPKIQSCLPHNAQGFNISSNIDFNCLCIICGVNFESEDELNSHLYDSHQPAESDLTETGTDNNDGSTYAEIEEILFACKHCKKEFCDREEMRAHQVECKLNIKLIRKSTDQLNVREPVKSEGTNSDENSGVIVRWVCKYCKVFFSKKAEMRLHKLQCSQSRGVVPVPDLNNSEVMVPFVCNFCKKSFSNKTELSIHNMLCLLQPSLVKTETETEVLIKWVCKYCRSDFQSRESMHTHKRTCLLRIKDRSVLSSAESDVSEKVCKDVDVHEATVCTNTGTEMIDTNTRTEMAGTHTETEMFATNTETEMVGTNTETEMGGTNIEREIVEDTVNQLLEKSAENNEAVLTNFSHNMKHNQNNISFEDIREQIMENVTCTNDVDSANSNNSVENSDNSEITEVNEMPKLKLKIKLTHKCSMCNKSFPLRKQLKLHKLEAHMFKCNKCHHFFGDSKTLWGHNRICRGQRISSEACHLKELYSCKKCHRVFREPYKYQLHKGSCLPVESATEIVSKDIIIPGQELLLRICCTKCNNTFTGPHVFKSHLCEKWTPVNAYIICCCGTGTFKDIKDYCLHCSSCATAIHRKSTKGFWDSTKFQIACNICMRQFSSVVKFYHHLMSNPSCQDRDGSSDNDSNEYIFASSIGNKQQEDDINSTPTSTDSDSSSSDETVDSGSFDESLSGSPETNGHYWICTFCGMLISKRFSRNRHYKACKKFKQKSLFSSNEIPEQNFEPLNQVGYSDIQNKICRDSEKILEHMASCYVILHRLPPNVSAQIDNQQQTLPVATASSHVYQFSSIQKCVICHKKCRLGGVRLPPIGQLECFRCREKAHRKDLKKKGEQFYSRSSISDEALETDYDVKLNVKGLYLDPSKRLKITRAKAKDNKNSGQMQQHHLQKPFNISAPVGQVPVSVNTSKRSPLTLIHKCPHCKRSFSTKEQYQKHIELSKTCLLAGSSHFKTNHIVPQTSYTTFANGLPRGVNYNISSPNAKDAGLNQSCEKLTNNYVSDHSYSAGCLNSFGGDSSSLSVIENELAKSQQAPFCQGSTLSKNASNRIRPSYLLLESFQKVLLAKPEIKTVKISQPLQCDGWILNNQNEMNNGSVVKTKYICGGCYRSFISIKAFVEHTQYVHKRPADVPLRMSIMKHIPDELLEKASS